MDWIAKPVHILLLEVIFKSDFKNFSRLYPNLK